MNRHENKTHKGWLMSGAGNIFAIEIANSRNAINQTQAKQICFQNKADGYLGLYEAKSQEFIWNFFNSDGSVAEFCGNAARCAQAFLNQLNQSAHTKQKTEAGLVLSWTETNKNWVLMPKPKIVAEKKEVKIDHTQWSGFYCNTGVPHFVLEKTKLRHDEWLEVSRKLRSHSDFGEKGTNITWTQNGTNPLSVVTYERGVENFTQACGTGAMAAALWWKSKENQRSEFAISMPGGTLTVVFHETGWMMTGPVEKLGEWSF